jgi:hypothetical protein
MTYLLIALAAIAATVAALWLLGWRSTQNRVDPYFFLHPKLPIVEPFAFDKAGAKKSVDFWVLPEENSTQTRTFFIGFRTVLAAGVSEAAVKAYHDNNDQIVLMDMPVKITLTKLDEPRKGRVELFEMYDVPGQSARERRRMVGDIATRRFRTSSDISLLQKKGISFDYDGGKRYSEFEFCFESYRDARPTAPGHYRVEVEVLKDNEKLAGTTTELMISNFNPGK